MQADTNNSTFRVHFHPLFHQQGLPIVNTVESKHGSRLEAEGSVFGATSARDERGTGPGMAHRSRKGAPLGLQPDRLPPNRNKTTNNSSSRTTLCYENKLQNLTNKFFFPLVFLFLSVACHAQTSTEKSYPDEFALVTSSDGQLTYVKFPEGLALYVYDRDEQGKSNCNGGCAAAWPPVLAKADAEPIGDWTPILRDNGSKQWAYKQKPVYLYFHDIAGKPLGAEQEAWNLLDLEL